MKSLYSTKMAVLGLCTSIFFGCASKSSEQVAADIGHNTVELVEPVKSVEIIADPSLPVLPIETTGRVEVLPSEFPETWIYVDESSFMSMFGGKVIVMDAAEKKFSKRIKGTADKNLLGNFLAAKTRAEFYIMESFHERGSRGPKTDIFVIYDKTTLTPIKELVWPETRLQALPRRHAMALSSDEKFLFVANFSPAGSITVVNLDTREITDTIGTPGCVLTFSTGKRSVTSMCSNGGLLTSTINDLGKKKSQNRIAPFFDTDKTPIFERPAIIDGIAYFPSFTGALHAVDLNNDIAEYTGQWDLLSAEQKTQQWRPGGLALNDADEQGLFYIIMNPDGKDGSQTHGGSQVWVFDINKKQRIRVIDTPSWAVSIAVTRGKEPLLIVTNGEMNLDVYNAQSGELVQTLSDFGNVTPLVIHKAY